MAEKPKTIFTATKRFKEAIDLLNRIDGKKLPVLLSRVIVNLHDGKNDKVFTEEEETQIRSMVNVSAHELDSFVNAASYIFETGAYHNLSEEQLKSSLEEQGMAALQAVGFARVWAEHKGKYFAKLSEHTLGAPLVLKSSNWRLHMATAQNNLLKTKELRSVFNFELADANSANPNEAQNITLELSQEDLQSLFDKLETIQGQLDALTRQ